MNKGSLLAEREETEEDRRKLGVNGLALQYANIVMLIDTMVREGRRERMVSRVCCSWLGLMASCGLVTERPFGTQCLKCDHSQTAT